jgi:hypothetical protein
MWTGTCAFPAGIVGSFLDGFLADTPQGTRRIGQVGAKITALAEISKMKRPAECREHNERDGISPFVRHPGRQ